uniref:Uncharacterized protein n=1 Tax=uncultured prokaryote TaxID=198431 RepID=A0A0H5Q8K3_9ZZZZ|nr:hypothetical protein [uncultured prokaryote]
MSTSRIIHTEDCRAELINGAGDLTVTLTRLTKYMVQIVFKEECPQCKRFIIYEADEWTVTQLPNRWRKRMAVWITTWTHRSKLWEVTKRSRS